MCQCPDQFEVFLNIVMNKGNIAFVRTAELISQCFNRKVPEHVSASAIVLKVSSSLSISMNIPNTFPFIRIELKMM
uniref:Uncharacterized protein n=1 Tax=Amphimedon queenslandica TaxID=400682 RepID=A0A1X7V9K8_AMPQE